MLNKILTLLFYTLFAVTPLFWGSHNYELFEYNKMMLVYGLTVAITAVWLIKMLRQKQLILKTTPLDPFLLLFLGANILSTIFSVDQHTSIWGYYSRSNGGLLSTISYILLYYALVSNFTSEYVGKFLKAIVFGGVVVALYAIPEHFGVSPSCIILTGDYNAACWVQDVQARVFATLGQPNWLAAYLAMVIFPAIYFALTVKSKLSSYFYLLSAVVMYLAFTFTYSRGAALGVAGGLFIFVGFLLYRLIQKGEKTNWHLPLLILTIFLVINILFGSALTSFKLLNKFAPPPRPSLTLSSNQGTQLENGGTESGQIRLIVWKGALDIFRHYPLFGSGVETFAYTYYNYRPMEHNLVSEWDFLYNKAHNEYLNYLATTGIAGFASYTAVILVFVAWSVKKLIQSKEKNKSQTFYLLLALLAAQISYLVQNVFGFSVVIIALFFYLFPALAFLGTDSLKTTTVPSLLRKPASLIYRRPLYYKMTLGVIIGLSLIFLYRLINFWEADTLFAAGNQASETGRAGVAYNKLYYATQLNPGEPLYQSELSYAAAAASASLTSDDATLSGELKQQAVTETNKLLAEHPYNVSFYRTAIRTYFMLSTGDKSYTQKTIELLDQTSKLAPTDPKLLYNKALILSQMGQNNEAADILQKVLQMKSNYKEAYLSLGDVYVALGQKDKAVAEMNQFLKVIPNDPQALEKIADWNK